jgi:CHAT domain-containing protein/tetratricopeptide (TPR) repeat protein
LLSAGVAVGREIKGGESNLFGVWMEAGQYASITVRRLGVDLLVNVAAPGGGMTTRRESPAGPQSSMSVSLIAPASGVYTLEVKPVEKWAAAGRYEIVLEGIRPPDPSDEKRFAAQLRTAEGRRQQLLDTVDSRRAALAAYDKALAMWEQVGVQVEEANTLQFVAQTYRAFPPENIDSDMVIKKYSEALDIRRKENDTQATAYTLLELAGIYIDLKNFAASLPLYDEALGLFKDNQRGQAAALYGRGLAKARLREMPAALKDYEEALRIYGDPESRDRHEEATTLHAIGGAYDVMGEPERASEFFHRALDGWQETGDLAQAGNAYNSIAKLYDDRGDWQAALDFYNKALKLYAQGEEVTERGKSSIRRKRAVTLYNLSFTYAALADYEKAFDLLKQSLALRDGDAGKGITLTATGYFHALKGEAKEALEYCTQALPLQVRAGDTRRSHTLTVMGIAYAAQGDHLRAIDYYRQALEIQQSKDRPDPQMEAITQVRLGESLAARGANEEALAAYGRARQLYRKYRDRNGEALTLFGIARVERNRNNLTAALKYVEDALATIEPLRANVTSQQLRVSFFADKVDYYELYIDLSMRLATAGGGDALTALAFEASERARARSLLDVLSQARVEAGRKGDPELAALTDKNRQLRRELSSAKMRRDFALDEKGSAAELNAQISKLDAELESTEAQIQSRYPRYASLMYPRPLSAASVQSLLDDDTLLLEFALGEERSYVWALTATEFRGYVLPPRSEIEAKARRLLDLLRAGQSLPREAAAQRQARMDQAEVDYWPLAAAFSWTLLSPAASLLQKRRLLIVADGQLSYLPFGALPAPSEVATSDPSLAQTPSGTPLVTDHDVVSLPSASVLSVLRQTARREKASKSVAVFADPVFEKDDPRIQLAGRAKPTTAEHSDALTQALRETDGDGVGDPPKLQRLLASGREARDIVSLAPPSSFMEATGFQASRENVTDARLSQYQVVHFATHSILNERNPERSGVVLSLYDERGRFHEDGFLRLGDIFGLSLPVDLVVLSACRTGLGKEFRGEGLIGLTRGFMYAGAPRVIASLWKVDDDATAELMKRFYQKMLKERMTPASALRSAQASMYAQKRWANPYNWAGFVLQGEPK